MRGFQKKANDASWSDIKWYSSLKALPFIAVLVQVRIVPSQPTEDMAAVPQRKEGQEEHQDVVVSLQPRSPVMDQMAYVSWRHWAAVSVLMGGSQCPEPPM